MTPQKLNVERERAQVIDTDRPDIYRGEGTSTIEGFIGEIMRFLYDIQIGREKYNNVREKIFDKEGRFLTKIDKRMEAINIIEEERKGTRRDNVAFIGRINNRLRDIGKYDVLMAKALGRIVHSQFQKDPIVNSFCKIILNYPADRVYSHFVKYKERYEKRLQTSENLYIAKKVMELIDRFIKSYRSSEYRINIINVDAQKVKSLSWDRTKNAIEEANSVWKNLKKMFGNNFDKIVKSDKRHKPALHLVQYQEEIKLLMEIREKIRMGAEEGNWEHFEEVFKNAPKTAEELSSEYGDEYASMRFKEWAGMISGKRRIGQYPPGWYKKVRGLIGELRSSWGSIVYDAIRSFDVILYNSREYLEKIFLKVFEDIKEEAKGLLGVERKKPKRLAKKIIEMSKKRKKAIKEISEIKRKEFLNFEKQMMIKVNDFWGISKKLIEESGMEDIIKEVPGIQRRFKSGVETSKVVGDRLGVYDNLYDIVIGADLIRRATSVISEEDSAIRSSAKIAYTILKLGRKTVILGIEAKQALEGALKNLLKFQTEVKVNARRRA